MNENVKKFYFWECWGSGAAGFGMLLFLANFFINPPRTIFFVLFFLSLVLMVWGLTVGGMNSSRRKDRERENFINAYNHCPHCSGTGWIRKEK